MGDLGGLSQLLQQYGYAGLAVCLVLNCMGVPIASEVLLPLAGVLIRRGELDLNATLVVAMLAQMVGLAASYVIARKGGVELVERFGRYIFLRRRQLDWLQQLFKRHGDGLIFAGSLIPGVHGSVGYPGGLAKMPFGRYLFFSGIATVLWTLGFVGLGWLLADKLELMGAVAHGVGGVTLVVLLLVIAGIWYSKSSGRKK